MSKFWAEAHAAFTNIAAERLGIYKRLLLAASAANAQLLWQWREAIYVAPVDSFYLYWPVHHRDNLALLLILFLLTAIFFLAITAITRIPKPWNDRALILFLALLMVTPAHFIMQSMNISLSYQYKAFLLVVTGAVLLLSFLQIMGIPAFVGTFLLISPYVVFTVGETLWSLASPVAASPAPRPLQSHFVNGKQRIIWLMFDELDERILSDHLAELPNFRALENKSLVAMKAVPPGGSTLRAVPEFLTGQHFIRVRPSGASSLIVTRVSDGKTVPFDAKQSVFAHLHNMGASVAISGWQLPYCRLFAGYVDWCRSKLGASLISGPTRNFGDAVGSWLHTLMPLDHRRSAHVLLGRTITDGELLACSDLKFVYIHVPVPHYPTLWYSDDANIWLVAIEIARSVFAHDPGYLQNLRVADAFLGKMVATLKQCGKWDKTDMVVSADHGLREPYRNYDSVFNGPRGRRGSPGDIPLIVHFAGRDKEEKISEELDTIHIGNLIAGLWGGSVTNGNQIVAVMKSETAAGQ